jgi:exosortase/archaeosortase
MFSLPRYLCKKLRRGIAERCEHVAANTSAQVGVILGMNLLRSQLGMFYGQTVILAVSFYRLCPREFYAVWVNLYQSFEMTYECSPCTTYFASQACAQIWNVNIPRHDLAVRATLPDNPRTFLVAVPIVYKRNLVGRAA